MKSTLTIENFKCFKKQEIEFRDLTVLVGANSVGKSTVVQALLLSRESLTKDVIVLNDIYKLNLGNTQEVLNRDSNENLIKFHSKDFPCISPNMTTVLDVPKKEDSYELNLKQRLFSPITGLQFNGNIYYLNAERIGPRLNHQVGSSTYPHVGYMGEYTIQVFEQMKDESIALEKAYDKEERLTYYRQIQLWMDFITPGVEVSAPKLYEKVRTAQMTFGDSSPTNVGFGVSYILPIILNGLLAEKNSMFIVENPEAHLHPFGQSRIGQFLAKIAAAGVQVIVETHSEHVINGIRLASAKDIIATNAIQINFFKKEENEVTIVPISINDASDLSLFPKGFFDQVQRDAMEMLRIKKNKNLL